MSPFPVRSSPEVTSVIIEPLMNLIFVSDRRYRARVGSHRRYPEKYSRHFENVSPRGTTTSIHRRARAKRRRKEEDERAICTHVIITKKFRVHQCCFRLKDNLFQKLRVCKLHHVQITGKIFGSEATRIHPFRGRVMSSTLEGHRRSAVHRNHEQGQQKTT